MNINGLSDSRQAVLFYNNQPETMEKSILNTTINPLPAGMADLITPVTVYLKIRDRYPNAILLESSDYHGTRNSMSYICFDVISVFRVEDFKIQIVFPRQYF